MIDTVKKYFLYWYGVLKSAWRVRTISSRLTQFQTNMRFMIDDWEDDPAITKEALDKLKELYAGYCELFGCFDVIIDIERIRHPFNDDDQGSSGTENG